MILSTVVTTNETIAQFFWECDGRTSVFSVAMMMMLVQIFFNYYTNIPFLALQHLQNHHDSHQIQKHVGPLFCLKFAKKVAGTDMK